MEPTLYEAVRRVNVRTAPSMQSKIADTLDTGAQTRIVGLVGDWAETSESEYVKIEHLRALHDPEEVTDDET